MRSLLVTLLPLSSRGQGHLLFTEETGIRIPPGVFCYVMLLMGFEPIRQRH